MELFFWVFDLLLPAVVLLMGIVFTLRPPRHINMLYGYRTTRSTSSQAMWDEAHRFSGRIYLYIGTALVAFAVAVKLLAPFPPETTCLALSLVSLVCVFIPIPITERYLKRMEREK